MHRPATSDLHQSPHDARLAHAASGLASGRGRHPAQPAPAPQARDVLIGSLASGCAGASLIMPVILAAAWLWLIPAVVVPLCVVAMALRVRAQRRRTARRASTVA